VTITVTAPTANRIYQRNLGRTHRDMVFSGTYSGNGGATPAGIQAKVINASTSAVVVNWTTLTSATISGGTWTGTLPNVPQGCWYTLQVRWSDITTDTATDTNQWGIGIFVICAGQSNCHGLGFQSGINSTNTNISVYDAGILYAAGWRKLSATGYRGQGIAEQLNEFSGVPVGLMFTWADGTAVQAHIPGTTLFDTTHTNRVAAAGGEAEAFVWIQGEGGVGDYYYQTNSSYTGRDDESYEISLGLVHEGFAGLVGRSVWQLPAVLASINRWTATYAQAPNYQRQWMAQQRAIRNCANALPAVTFSHSMVGYEQNDDANMLSPGSNTYSPSYSQDGYHWVPLVSIEAGVLFGRSVVTALGYARGTPAWYIVQATSVSETETDVMVCHSLGTDFTGTGGSDTGLTGFEVSGDGGTTWETASADRYDANTVRLTHSALPEDYNRKMRYLWGSSPLRTNIVCDNSDYTALLCQTIDPITVESAYRVAVPTFVGALTANAVSGSITWDIGVRSTGEKLVVVMVISQSISAATISDFTPDTGDAVTPTLSLNYAAGDGRGVKIWTAVMPREVSNITYTHSSTWKDHAVFVLPADELASTTPTWSGGSYGASGSPATLTTTVPSRGILLGGSSCSNTASGLAEYDSSDIDVEICKDWNVGRPTSFFRASNLSAGSPVLRMSGFGNADSYIAAICFQSAYTDNALEELPTYAANFPKVAYYEFAKPYINLVNHSWNSYDRRITGAAGVVGGSMWDYYTGTYNWTTLDYVHTGPQSFPEFDLQFSRLKPGKYIALWSGPNEVQLAPGISDTAGWMTIHGLVAPNRYEVTVNDERSSIRWTTRTPGSGTSPGYLNDLVILHEDEEDRWNAGEIFAQDFLNTYANCTYIRFMDAINTNGAGYQSWDIGYNSVERGDFNYEGDRSYASKMPFSLMGKLCKKLGCDIWLSMPHKASRACMRTALQEIFDTGFAGKVYLEYSNEYWNSGFSNTRTWLTNVKAEGLDTDGDGNPLIGYSFDGISQGTSGGNRIAAGAALGAAQLWYEAEQIFGRSRVKRVIAGQHVYFDNMAAQFYSINPFTGNTIAEDIDVYAVAPYFFITNVTPEIPSNYHPNLVRSKTYTLPGEELFNGFASYMEAIEPSNPANEVKRLALFPQAEIHSYEGGFDIVYPSNYSPNPAEQMYKCTIDPDGKSLVTAEGGSFVTSGEQVCIARRAWTSVDWTQVLSVPSSQITGGNWYYCRKHTISGINYKLWLYPSLAAYSADTTPNGTGAITMDTAGSGYRYFIHDWNRRGIVSWADTTNNMLDYGTDITEDFDDGDQIQMRGAQGEYGEGGIYPGAGIVGSTRYLVKKSGTNKLKLYSNWDNYDADIPIALTNGDSTWWFFNVTRAIKFRNWLGKYLEGMIGRDLYYRAVHAQYKGYIKTFNHYTGSASWGSGSNWGLVADEYSTPTPRALYLYSLGSGGTTALEPTELAPNADVVVGVWTPSTGADLYPMIDESVPSDDDYIYTTSVGSCAVAFESTTDPGTDSGHLLRYRAKGNGSSGLIVRLKEGTTTIETWTHSLLPSTFTSYEQSVTPSNFSAITDFTSLRLEFEAT
jgi:hypothetical protein